MRPVLKWELWGIAFIFVMGALVHFAYELSGESRTVALFVPVNESVWEHLRLHFVPLLLWAAVEYRFIRNDVDNFLLSKAVSIYLIPLAVLAFFYIYKAITGGDSLAFDIISFGIAVAIGQMVSCWIMGREPAGKGATWLAVLSIVLLWGIFALFTFYPPHAGMFLDSGSGIYGIGP